MPETHHLDRRAEQLVAACEGPDDEMLDTTAVAVWFGVSKRWLENGRSNGYGPKFQKLSPTVIRYRRGDVRAWLTQRVHARTSEYAA